MANKRLKQKKLKNARFVHLHGADLEKINDRTYTHGILSFVIHEMDHSDRLMVLKSAKKIVPQLVILDYHTPHPYSLWGIFTRLIEFLAGNTHYTNFRDYLERNGLNAILDEAGFHIVHHLINRKKVFSTVVAVASEQRKSLT